MEDPEHYNNFLASQIFSVDLILEQIFVHLNVPDLLNLRLVNKKCGLVAGKILRKCKLCAIRVGRNPCVILQLLNKTLESSTTSPFYNGIELIPEFPKRCSKYGIWDKFDCCDDDCLSAAPGAKDPPNVREMYGNILRKLKFRVFRFDGVITPGCPFANLIQTILTDKAEELVELKLCGVFFSPRDIGIRETDIYSVSFWEYLAVPESRKSNWFPKLKIYEGCSYRRFDCELALTSPNLTTMKHAVHTSMFNYQLLPSECPGLVRSKHNTLTNIYHCLEIEDIEYLATYVQPKLRKFRIIPPTDSIEKIPRWENCLVQLGRIVQFTLEDLEVSLFGLALLSNAPAIPSFSSLRRLRLIHQINYKEDEEFDLLKSVDFKNKFPNVKSVLFRRLSNRYLPYGLAHSKSYEKLAHPGSLTVEDIEVTEPNETNLSGLSVVFPAVTTLTVTIESNCYRSLFLPSYFIHPNILFRENAEWPDIEHLKFLKIPDAIRSEQSNVDCWFIPINYLKPSGPCSNTVIIDNNLKSDPALYSLFHKKHLKSISIEFSCYRDSCCLLYQSQKEVRDFLVSKEVAKLICEKLPGFIVELSVFKLESCNRSFHEGLDFAHLYPYASVLTAWTETIYRSGDYRKKWRIQFQETT